MDWARFAMHRLRWGGAALEGAEERLRVWKNGCGELAEWVFWIHRLRILQWGQSRFPDEFRLLDGGDKRLMRSFLDPDPASKTISLLGRDWRPLVRNLPPLLLWMCAPERVATAAPLIGRVPALDDQSFSEFSLDGEERISLAMDALGGEAACDTSAILEHEGARAGRERWFFINGIIASRAIAQRNADKLRGLLKRSFITIHNPTQGLVTDLVESALQKFTNVTTEPVALAIVQIANALADPSVDRVGVVAHSQGTIIVGDFLDLVYYALDPRSKTHLAKTNMNSEDIAAFLRVSHARVNSDEVRHALALLEGRDDLVKEKLELYMFANAASRMCYLDPRLERPHIESFANEHDLVARLGCLAEDTFHEEDLIRIDGPVFMRRGQYGHLLNAHYLSGDLERDYLLLPEASASCPPRRSLHDPVLANPCCRNVKCAPRARPARSRLLDA